MKVLVDVKIESRHSAQKDRDYEVVVFTFGNGYSVEQFVNGDRKFLINLACQDYEKESSKF